MNKCPYCGREIPPPEIYQAVEKERQIWNPFGDRFYTHTESPDSITLDISDYDAWRW